MEQQLTQEEQSKDAFFKRIAAIGVPGMGTGLEVKVLYGASW